MLKLKKMIPFLVLIPNLFACSSNVNQIYLFNTSIFQEKKCELKFFEDDNLTYHLILDGNSYYDVLNETTYRAYTFLSGWQVYNNDGLVVNPGTVCIPYSEIFFQLIDPILLNSNNFDIKEKYILKETALNKYCCEDYIRGELTGLEISLIDQTLVYNFKTDESNYRLEFNKSQKELDYYDSQYLESGDYYDSNLIDSVEEYNGIITSYEDCVVIFIDDDCYYCAQSEKLYYDFAYEYDCFPLVFSMKIRDFEETFKNDLFREINKVYTSQAEELKNRNYSEYPSTFLTPSAIRFSMGQVKYVKPGFRQGEKDLIYKVYFD